MLVVGQHIEAVQTDIVFERRASTAISHDLIDRLIGSEKEPTLGSAPRDDKCGSRDDISGKGHTRVIVQSRFWLPRRIFSFAVKLKRRDANKQAVFCFFTFWQGNREVDLVRESGAQRFCRVDPRIEILR